MVLSDQAILEYKAFNHAAVLEMAAEAEVPEVDQDEVAAYIGEQVRGPHEGNVIRYRLLPDDLDGFDLG
ncbi:MAG: hypothetical protein QGI70_14265 [Paracoccaceae bacterium]|jgi:hypothetical protein|nr:hypothetical protein [Paracoccaceae bacterium]